MGRYYVAHAKPDLAIAPLNDALAQFVKNGQAMDAARAQLFLAAAKSHNDPAGAQAILEQTLSSVQRSDSRHLLFVIGQINRSDLERLAAQADDNKTIIRFLKDIERVCVGSAPIAARRHRAIV